MISVGETMAEVLATVRDLGLADVQPVILNNAGNLTVHLVPYPLVARIAKLFQGDHPEYWRGVWLRELKVVDHLRLRGVPVVPYAATVPPGPHPVGDTWMTLWEYAEPTSLPALGGQDAVHMVSDLAEAMLDFHEPLPTLGVWGHVRESMEGLRDLRPHDDRIVRLLLAFEEIDGRMRGMETFVPAHGDAHPGNLLSTGRGWRWIDFEDVSLMPPYWDYASFIGNTALFHGFDHPVVACMVSQYVLAKDRPSFQFALRARAVMSTTTNLFLALQGHGDLEFANSQLDRIHGFLDGLGDE